MQFSTTIGHEKQKNLFMRLLAKKSLAHAYVFTGPEHAGKTTFALDLARALGVNEHLDLVVFDSASGMSIEEARTLRSRLALTAVSSPYQMGIITYAEKMTLEAANALLKFLEEPPAKLVLILITANFYALLPTIASRVQKISFGLLTDDEVRRAVSDEEIVRAAIGRIGLAKKFAEDSEEYEFFLKSKEYYKIMEMGKINQRLLSASQIAELSGEEVEKFLKLGMEHWVREGTVPKLGEKFLQALKDYQSNLNTKLMLDNLFLP